MTPIILALRDIRTAQSLEELNVILRLSPVHRSIITASRKRARQLEKRPPRVERECVCGCGTKFTPASNNPNQRFASRKCGCKWMRSRRGSVSKTVGAV